MSSGLGGLGLALGAGELDLGFFINLAGGGAAFSAEGKEGAGERLAVESWLVRLSGTGTGPALGQQAPQS